MKKYKIDLNNPSVELINLAAKVLAKNGVIIYPTDTAYGIGANALDENAVKKVYELKIRSFDKPTHVIVRDWEMITKLCYTNNAASNLFKAFFPGPLTIILKKKNIVPDILTANLPTLGVRIPDCEVTKMISKQVNFPYTTPSANTSGGKTPYSLNEALDLLDNDLIDLALDAGKLEKKDPSTLIDLSTNIPKILREGPVKKTAINKYISF